LLEAPPGHVLSDLVEENLSNVLARPITPKNFDALLRFARH
jgi:hypothetical protein